MTTDMDAGLPDLAAVARLYHQNGYNRASVGAGPGRALVLQSDASAWRQAATLRAQMVADQADEIASLQAHIDALAVALECAEAALADIGDADREPGDDVKWCEQRAAEAIPEVRAALATVGR